MEDRAAGNADEGATWTAWLVLAVAVAATIAGLRTDRPPRPLPATAPADEFSAARARAHLRHIARAPHPVGSAAHAQVRDYVRDALVSLGLDAEVRAGTSMSPFVDNYGGYVENVVARLRGTGSTGAVLLLAHYDSVPGSPGASDDGAGVAAVLETLRALQARSPLRNDVIALISDAEEVGLLGAAEFVRSHEWFDDVAVVLNVEARGSYGGVAMFHTIGTGGAFIPVLAAATARPVANTVMQEVYRRLPNATDLTVFDRLSEVAGLDFAYADGLSHYHTPLDSLDTQSPASLQHHGAYLMGLTLALGDRDLSSSDEAEYTYFNAGPFGLVYYPMEWVLPLASLLAVWVAGSLLLGLRSGRLRPARLGLGLVATVAVVAGGVGLGYLGWQALESLTVSPRWDPYRLYYDSAPYLLALSAAVAALALAVGALQRRAGSAETVAVPVLLWTAGAVAAGLYAPGVSYLLAWPALAASLLLWLPRKERLPWWQGALMAVTALPALVLVAPWTVWLESAMTLRLAPAIAGVPGLVLALLMPQLVLICRRWRWRPVVAALAVSLLGVAWALAMPEYDERRPRPNSLLYAADLDSGEAYWTSTDPDVDGWTRQRLGEAPRRGALPHLGLGSRERWLQPAQPLALGGPRVTPGVAAGSRAAAVSVAAADPVAGFTVRIDVPPGTFRTTLELVAGGEGVESWTLDGGHALVSPQGGSSARLLTYMGQPPDGLMVRLQPAPTGPFTLRVRATIPGLPERLEPRPGAAMDGGDTTVLQRTFTFNFPEPERP